MTKRDAPTRTQRAGESTWFSRNEQASSSLALGGKLRNHGTNPTPKWIRGGLLSLAVANMRVQDICEAARHKLSASTLHTDAIRGVWLGIEWHRLAIDDVV